MNALHRRDEGLTLTELMVSLFLLAAVSAVFLPMMESSLTITGDLQGASRTGDAGRLALERLDREFRAAERICQPLAGGNGNRLEFRTRAWTGTTTASGYQDLVYEVVGTDLQRSSGAGVTTVIENVVNPPGDPVFASASAGGSPSEGKVVTVRLWVDGDLDDRLGPRLMTTELTARNVWTAEAPGC